MTLIANAIHKRQAFLAVDSRLTVDGNPVDESAIKNAYITCKRGKLLLGFAGIADIDDTPTIEWVLNEFSEVDLGKVSAREAMQLLGEKLTHYFQQTYYRRPPELIITASGWEDSQGKYPKLLSLANCLNGDGKLIRPDFEFKIVDYDIPPHGSKLIILGDLRVTSSKPFKKTISAVERLLGRSVNKLNDEILAGMVKLIALASSDPASTTINDYVRASRMDKTKEGIVYTSNSEKKSYSLPGFSTPNKTVSGITIKNDFVIGGTTIIGGPPR